MISLETPVSNGACSRVLTAMREAIVGVLVAVLWLYKNLVSRPLHLVAGPSCGCRFHPTCSDYAVEAVKVHGPLYGLYLAARRLLRCTPLNPGGVDFVPAPHALRPRCARTVSSRPTS